MRNLRCIHATPGAGKALNFALAGLLAVFLPGAVTAQDDLARPPPIPEASEDYIPLAPVAEGDLPIPPKIQQEQVDPTVRIIDEEDRMIEEYSVNGKVYMVKVTPKKGLPYYYIDTDGDGKLELDPDQRALNPVQPVYWKIAEWD
ncbi:MAG: DUF2782 domain-containing protein [Xanthomonadales bacterium]|jgi:hypothetical protein|nr:DUF2782 domain-containing protein [Xanthomonadales bacterium]